MRKYKNKINIDNVNTELYNILNMQHMRRIALNQIRKRLADKANKINKQLHTPDNTKE
jgi:hypothetical protein